MLCFHSVAVFFPATAGLIRALHFGIRECRNDVANQAAWLVWSLQFLATEKAVYYFSLWTKESRSTCTTKSPNMNDKLALLFCFFIMSLSCLVSSFTSNVRKSFHSKITPQRIRHSRLFSSSCAQDNNSVETNSVNNMASVTFETASNNTRTFQIQSGEILRTAMLRRGISPHNGKSRLINCRGLGTCGTCAVEIPPHQSDETDCIIKPSERTTKENLRLNFPPHGSKEQSPNLRLACQVQVMQGDVTVCKRTGFWGQGDMDGELAEEYEAELWFGDLEYVLDDKSPEKMEWLGRCENRWRTLEVNGAECNGAVRHLVWFIRTLVFCTTIELLAAALMHTM